MPTSTFPFFYFCGFVGKERALFDTALNEKSVLKCGRILEALEALGIVVQNKDKTWSTVPRHKNLKLAHYIVSMEPSTKGTNITLKGTQSERDIVFAHVDFRRLYIREEQALATTNLMVEDALDHFGFEV